MAERSRKVNGRTDRTTTKAFGAGYGLWVGLAIGLFVAYSIADLISGLLHAEISLPLALDAPLASLTFPAGTAWLVGITELAAPTEALATETIVFLIISKVTLIFTAIACAVALVPVIRDIACGTPFTDRAIRALGALEWFIAGGFGLYVVVTILGSNLASRDLGIADEAGAGISSMQAFLLLGTVGGIELLRRCFSSGRQAQDDIDGLV